MGRRKYICWILIFRLWHLLDCCLSPSCLPWNPLSPLQNWQGCFNFFSLKAEYIRCSKHLSLVGDNIQHGNCCSLAGGTASLAGSAAGSALSDSNDSWGQYLLKQTPSYLSAAVYLCPWVWQWAVVELRVNALMFTSAGRVCYFSEEYLKSFVSFLFPCRSLNG